MITYARENLSTDEFMLFLDLLVPEPVIEPVKPAKKKRKPRTGTKSQRAASLAEQIKATGKVKDDNNPNAHCQKDLHEYGICDEAVDANVHHLHGTTGYHEFVVAGS